jgi:hypothetical protein
MNITDCQGRSPFFQFRFRGPLSPLWTPPTRSAAGRGSRHAGSARVWLFLLFLPLWLGGEWGVWAGKAYEVLRGTLGRAVPLFHARPRGAGSYCSRLRTRHGSVALPKQELPCCSLRPVEYWACRHGRVATRFHVSAPALAGPAGASLAVGEPASLRVAESDGLPPAHVAVVRARMRIEEGEGKQITCSAISPLRR